MNDGGRRRRRAAKEIRKRYVGMANAESEPGLGSVRRSSRDRSKSEGKKDIAGGVPGAAGGRRRKFDKDRCKYLLGMVLCM